MNEAPYSRTTRFKELFSLGKQEHSLQPAAAAVEARHMRPGSASLYAGVVGPSLEPFVHVRTRFWFVFPSSPPRNSA